MKKSAIVASAAAAALLTAAGLAAAPSAAAAPGDPGTRHALKRYLVTAESASATAGLVSGVERAGGDVDNVYSRVLPGFSATMTAEQAKTLTADSRVDSVTPDGVVHATGTQTNPTWGLDRLDQRARTGDKAYRYDTTGAGVTAYVIDTGVMFSHSQFGGRAVSGYDFSSDDTNASDCAGHGTHVSGTIAGSTYGVAKAAKIVSLRVLDCDGSGYFSDVIYALDWVVGHKSKGGSVVNLSLGGPAYAALDQAVERTVAAGVTVVVAAGNSGENACTSSPARAKAAITVAATDSSDRRPSWSNYGSCVDVFAPGVNVLSASMASTSSSETMSGTSMATPHVTGVVARYLQTHPTATPAQTAAAVLTSSTANMVVGPSGAPNRLLYATPPATAPTSPTKVAVSTDNSRRTATITWAAPSSDGGKPITSYAVSRDGKSSTGADPVTVSVSAKTRSYTFTQLSKGASYTLSVRAVSSAGASPSVAKKSAALR